MWKNDYEELLIEWAALRDKVSNLPLDETLYQVQEWWQQAPIVNPFIHITDYENWPSPWELLEEDGFDELTKCLGMCYTLLLLEHKDIISMRIVQTDSYIMLLVNNDQYMLNDEPGNIMYERDDSHIIYSVNAELIKNKI